MSFCLGTTRENETLFKYRNGKSYKDYVTNHANFTPKFLDEADPDLVRKAESVCNGTEDRQCIIDYVFTLNENVAKNTQTVQIQAQENEVVLGKAVVS